MREKLNIRRKANNGLREVMEYRNCEIAKSASGWVKTLAIISVVTFLIAPAAVSANDAATQVVEDLHAALLKVMKNAEELGYHGRYQELAPVVTARYDFPFIARIVVGRHWRKFTPEQKQQFVLTFTKLSIATYANRFDGYSGELFKTLSSEELKGDQFLVKTILIKANGEEVDLDYVLHQNNHTWRIINVVAQGVSDLSLKRADYTAYLKKNDFDKLLEKIKEKIKNYES
jgi:phospholipid transport system substrate-binding protein